MGPATASFHVSPPPPVLPPVAPPPPGQPVRRRAPSASRRPTRERIERDMEPPTFSVEEGRQSISWRAGEAANGEKATRRSRTSRQQDGGPSGFPVSASYSESRFRTLSLPSRARDPSGVNAATTGRPELQFVHSHDFTSKIQTRSSANARIRFES